MLVQSVLSWIMPLFAFMTDVFFFHCPQPTKREHDRLATACAYSKGEVSLFFFFFQPNPYSPSQWIVYKLFCPIYIGNYLSSTCFNPCALSHLLDSCVPFLVIPRNHNCPFPLLGKRIRKWLLFKTNAQSTRTFWSWDPDSRPRKNLKRK